MKFLIAASTSLFLLHAVHAQEGKLNFEFKAGTSAQWKTATKDALSEVKDDKLVITPALQTDGTYRGDITSTTDITLNAGKYPIIAIKINKKAKPDMIFDTNIGAIKSGSKRIVQSDGYDVYYWDISTKPFQRASDPVFDFPKDAVVLKKITFKYAAIKYDDAEISAAKIAYGIVWIKSFASAEELKASLK
ncbi:MAG: DUF4979 domain-containing protein [Lacibacter sp.]